MSTARPRQRRPIRNNKERARWAGAVGRRKVGWGGVEGRRRPRLLRSHSSESMSYGGNPAPRRGGKGCQCDFTLPRLEGCSQEAPTRSGPDLRGGRSAPAAARRRRRCRASPARVGAVGLERAARLGTCRIGVWPHQAAMAVPQSFPALAVLAHDGVSHLLDRYRPSGANAGCRVEVPVRCDDLVPRKSSLGLDPQPPAEWCCPSRPMPRHEDRESAYYSMKN